MRMFSSTLNENELIEFVEGKVFEVIKSAAKCKHDKMSRTASFEDLGFDSLDGVELVLAMEEYFGFDISNTEAEKITSVMDAIQVFHSHVVKRQSVVEGSAEQ
jgi:acyl carrier protein